MITAERSMGVRALTLLPPPGTSLAMLPSMKTNGARLRLMPTDQDDRDTLPPEAGPVTEMRPPPDGLSPLEEISYRESPENWAGFDEQKFMHRATAAVINGTNALLKAKQDYDIEAIVQRQRVLFEEAVSPKLDAIVSRVTTTESGLSALRVEFATMKARMNQLEAELARLTGASGQQQ